MTTGTGGPGLGGAASSVMVNRGATRGTIMPRSSQGPTVQPRGTLGVIGARARFSGNSDTGDKKEENKDSDIAEEPPTTTPQFTKKSTFN